MILKIEMLFEYQFGMPNFDNILNMVNAVHVWFMKF